MTGTNKKASTIRDIMTAIIWSDLKATPIAPTVLSDLLVHTEAAAQKYRDEGVAEVGMKCIKEQIEAPKVVIIDSLSDMYKYMMQDAVYTSSIHRRAALVRGIRIRQQMEEIDAACDLLKETNRLAKPITHRQQQWIDTIEFILGIKFTGSCYDDAWSWISEHKDGAAIQQKLGIDKQQHKAIKEICKCLHVKFEGRYRIQASKFIHRYAELVEHIREGYRDLEEYNGREWSND